MLAGSVDLVKDGIDSFSFLGSPVGAASLGVPAVGFYIYLSGEGGHLAVDGDAGQNGHSAVGFDFRLLCKEEHLECCFHLLCVYLSYKIISSSSQQQGLE